MSQESKSRQTGGSDVADADNASSPSRITIGVLEKDLLQCEGLAALLYTVEEFDCIGAWTQVQAALGALRELQPDLLLLDVRLLQGTGLTLFQSMPSLSPTTRILLTMNCPKEWWAALPAQPLPSQLAALALLPALQFGVCGIVCKERGFGWMTESIHRAYRGEHEIDITTITHIKESCSGSLHNDRVSERTQTESLSLREWQVLRLIGQGHSNKAIARELQLGYSTVKNYVSSILKKLQLEGRTQVALLAHQGSEEHRLLHRI